MQDSAAELVDHPTQASESAPVPGRALAAKASCWDNAARVGIQVAEALEYARGKGVLHRDIKPANLIVDRQGVVWVADFGLAKTLEQEHVSRTGEVLGTPAYVAPEQLRGQADHRSDIYSLGLTLYELLALRPAFQNADRALLLKRIATEEPPRLRQVCPQVPRDLETIVLKAIAHEPERRYQTAGELASDLRCFLEDRPIQARRATTVERFWRWCRRNPVVAALATTAAMLLLSVAVTASIGYASTNSALSSERTQRQRAEAATEVALEVLDRIYDRFAPHLPGTTGDESGDESGTNGAHKPMLSEGTAAVLEDMLVFYDRLAEQGGDEASYLEKTALASRRVGDIRHHLDQLDKAKAAYERSIDLYEQLDRSPGQTPHYLERVTALTELGIVEDRLGQGKRAEASWNAATQLAEQATKAGVASDELDQAAERARGFLNRRPEARLLRPLPLGPSDRRGPPLGPPDERFGEPPFRHRGPENGPRRPAGPPFGQP